MCGQNRLSNIEALQGHTNHNLIFSTSLKLRNVVMSKQQLLLLLRQQKPSFGQRSGHETEAIHTHASVFDVHIQWQMSTIWHGYFGLFDAFVWLSVPLHWTEAPLPRHHHYRTKTEITEEKPWGNVRRTSPSKAPNPMNFLFTKYLSDHFFAVWFVVFSIIIIPFNSSLLNESLSATVQKKYSRHRRWTNGK